MGYKCPECKKDFGEIKADLEEHFRKGPCQGARVLNNLLKYTFPELSEEEMLSYFERRPVRHG